MKRPWLLPFNPLYRAGLALKNHAFTTGRVEARTLRQPVLSVGSISAGGAGKTPAVLALAGLLTRSGYAVDVLSRGYGRASQRVMRVDPAGSAEDFGDEPLELAKAGLEVFVGADRYEAGLLAEASCAAQVHLLDDGFQHRRLARTFEAVVLTIGDVRDRLLPAGNLREPLSSLRRADALILREDEAGEIAERTSQLTDAAVWMLRRQLVLPASAPSFAFAFTGIARPRDFLKSVAEAGQRLAGHFTFPDHHRYTLADCTRLVAAACAAGADGFVTTAKDAVKLTPEFLAVLGPVAIARLQTSFLDERERIQPQLLRALGPVH